MADQPAPPLAHSSLEAHLYMGLHPCSCGDARFRRGSTLSELPNGDLLRRYAGRCARCGTDRRFEFRLPARPPEPGSDEIRYGDALPSELIDAGEWLWVADSYARTGAGRPSSVDLRV
jgi:hypothetical protein